MQNQRRIETARILKSVVVRLVEKFIPENIYLFGSHVWGTPNDGSDIDLMIIVSHSNIDRSELSIQAQGCIFDIDTGTADVFVKSQEEFENLAAISSTLENQILKEGKLLYERR